ncbi:hypothetical protein KAU33_13855 [Candidatus Dependentiae bacterium]|nr:hypothetical protein [Candidatus Dependentiae bacterium]
MKGKYLIFLMLILFLTSCSDSPKIKAGDQLIYDKFRGDESSVINIVQYESFSKCINTFDFKKYENKKVHNKYIVPNDFVEHQIKNIVNMKYIDNNIKSIEDSGPETADDFDYNFQYNTICGGYYIFDGFIFKKYQSHTRIVLYTTDIKNNKTYYQDSGYQKYSYFTFEFTKIFQIFIYIWISILIGLLIYLKLLKKKKLSI